jgi:hypothetical protein
MSIFVQSERTLADHNLTIASFDDTIAKLRRLITDLKKKYSPAGIAKAKKYLKSLQSDLKILNLDSKKFDIGFNFTSRNIEMSVISNKVNDLVTLNGQPPQVIIMLNPRPPMDQIVQVEKVVEKVEKVEKIEKIEKIEKVEKKTEELVEVVKVEELVVSAQEPENKPKNDEGMVERPFQVIGMDDDDDGEDVDKNDERERVDNPYPITNPKTRVKPIIWILLLMGIACVFIVGIIIASAIFGTPR